MSSYFDKYKNMQYIIETQGIITEVSIFFCEFTQYHKDELLGKTVHSVFQELLRVSIHLNEIAGVTEAFLFTKKLEVRNVYIQKTQYDRSDKIKYSIYEINNSRFEDKNQFIERLIADNVTGIGVYTAPDFILIRANQTYLNYLPVPFRSKEMSYGKKLKEIFDDFEGSPGETTWNELVAHSKSIYVKERPGLLKSEDIKYWDNTLTPIEENGKVKYLVSMLDDVTERVKNREYIKQQKEEFEAILDNMSEGVVAFNKYGNYVLQNKKVKEFAKRSTNIGKTVENVGGSVDLNERYYDINGLELSKEELPNFKVLRGEKVNNQRLMFKKGKEVFYYEYSGSPLYDDKGDFKLGVLLSRDVTELIEKEKQIKQKNKQLKVILESVEDIIYIVDKNGNILNSHSLFNDSMEHSDNCMLPADGIQYFDFDGNPYILEDTIGYKVFQKGEKVKNVKIKLVKKDETRYSITSGIPIFNSNDDVELGVYTSLDVTELMEKEQEIKEQKEQLDAILDNMTEGIVIVDSKGYILRMNATALQICGLSSFEKPIFSEDFARNFDLFTYDGSPLAYKEWPLSRVLRGEFVYDLEVWLCQKDTGIKRLCSYSGNSVYGTNGEVIITILTVRDITDQRIQQERLLEEEYEKNEALENAMKLKDEFLYLITHEFKTPLAVISSALQTLDLVCQNQMPMKAHKFISTIKQNTNRQLRLVNNLLDVARINSGNIKLNDGTYDIVYLTNSIVNSIQSIAQQKDVKVNFITSIHKKEILIDEEKFERILLNLLSNALKFTPVGKLINVTLYVKKYKNKNMICISVQDEGIGIPFDKQTDIFERFGQVNTILSRQAEGTGIGLHLVKLMVNAMGGQISLESQEGQGSNFTVMLPAKKPLPGNKDEESKQTDAQLVHRDSRLIQEIAIEFSDIYL
ncbi:ATP-binding protein [Sinanaerobacter chloroacetimidivorans]|jgi:signal transduction histidine kinase|uniref:histidine kinase n=1 Tax=Sinanaerobacter chloroacetimidivorans TaxID=2818044 RepID=A0A8J7W454_9FIRM|nr:ATP-binding protein [Sinanaerobacter chloroacetimidivorans]MBR0598875.1 PAS domain-containing protein [Sinanaerobacter chloroacetimidivorans]